MGAHQGTISTRARQKPWAAGGPGLTGVYGLIMDPPMLANIDLHNEAETRTLNNDRSFVPGRHSDDDVTDRQEWTAMMRLRPTGGQAVRRNDEGKRGRCYSRSGYSCN